MPFLRSATTAISRSPALRHLGRRAMAIAERLPAAEVRPIERPKARRTWWSPGVAGLLARASSMCRIALRHSAANRLAVAAVAADARDARAWSALSLAAEHAPGSHLVADPQLGMAAVRFVDGSLALDAATRARELAPDDRRVEERWLDCRLKFAALSGRPDAGDATSSRSARAWYLRSRLDALAAAERGAFTDELFEAHRTATRRALDAGGLPDARYHLIRVALRNADWPTAVDGALRCRPAPPGHVQSVADEIAEGTIARSGRPDDEITGWIERLEQTDGVPELLLVLHWRLVQASRHRLSFAAKDALARTLLRSSTSGSAPTAAALVARARCRATLGQHVDVLRSLDAANRGALRSKERRIVEKMAADLRFDLGDTRAHVARPRADRHHTIADWITGRRVAVIGPSSAVTTDLPDVDVVVRPRALASESGLPTIGYFPDVAAPLLQNEIGDALESGGIDAAVFRPTAVRILPDSLRENAGVRFASDEHLARLESSPYAIPRIVYDIARYQPLSIHVMSTDFFTRGRTYEAGLEPISTAREDLVGYGHDLRADHTAMARLRDAGVFTADDTADRVLDLTTDQYLDVLDGVDTRRLSADPVSRGGERTG